MSLGLMEFEFYLAANGGVHRRIFELLKVKLLDLHFRKLTLMTVRNRLKQLEAELPHCGVFRNVCEVILVAMVTGKCP